MTIVPRKGQIRAIAALALTIAPALLTACADPRLMQPTLHAQQQALDRITTSYEKDLALLRDQSASIASQRRTILLGQLHRELISRGYITPAFEPDEAALTRDLADPDHRGTLTTEIHTGRLTRAQAIEFLHDYALAMQMTREGKQLRPQMLARLGPIESHDATTDAIQTALDLHQRDISRLLEEAGANNTALLNAANQPTPQLDTLLTTTLRQLLISDQQPARMLDQNPERKLGE